MNETVSLGQLAALLADTEQDLARLLRQEEHLEDLTDVNQLEHNFAAWRDIQRQRLHLQGRAVFLRRVLKNAKARAEVALP